MRIAIEWSIVLLLVFGVVLATVLACVVFFTWLLLSGNWAR